MAGAGWQWEKGILLPDKLVEDLEDLLCTDKQCKIQGVKLPTFNKDTQQQCSKR